MEKQNDLMEDPWAWMDWYDRNDFAYSTFIMGMAALINAAFPILIWFLYLEEAGNRAGITDAI